MNILKVIVLGQLMLESMDEVKDTKIYSHGIKQQGNRFIKMLESHIPDKYDHVYDVDKEMVTNILNKISLITSELSTMDIVELLVMEALIDDYKNNKDYYNERLVTYFNRIE